MPMVGGRRVESAEHLGSITKLFAKITPLFIQKKSVKIHKCHPLLGPLGKEGRCTEGMHPKRYTTNQRKYQSVDIEKKFFFSQQYYSFWRGVRVVEGATLEMSYRVRFIEGSNPSFSGFFYFFLESILLYPYRRHWYAPSFPKGPKGERPSSKQGQGGSTVGRVWQGNNKEIIRK